MEVRTRSRISGRLPRLIGLGLGLALLGVTWLVYRSAAANRCSGLAVNAWFGAYSQRQTEANADFSADFASLTGSQWVAFTLRAQERYASQQSQSTPRCLADLQQKALERFYWESKAADAAAVGNYAEAGADIAKMKAAYASLDEEMSRLAARYGWSWPQGTQTPAPSAPAPAQIP
jgi:hypothetical protein